MLKNSKGRVVEVCHAIARRIPQWTQGGGGNVSLKDGDTLWIKSTGVRLGDVSMTTGIAELSWRKLRSELERTPDLGEEEYRDALQKFARGRPSMEAGFHALLDSDWVLHFHSVVAIWLAHEWRLEPRRIETWLSSQKFRLELVPAMMPGLELGRSVGNSISEGIVLENHGIILQCSDGNEEPILTRWRELEMSFCREFEYNETLEPALAAPLKKYFPDVAVFFERVSNVVLLGKKGHRINPLKSILDRDAAEIFQAIQLLHRECPALSELPGDLSDRIPNLPTEKLRRG